MALWKDLWTDILIVYYSLGVRDLYNAVIPLLVLPLLFFPLKGIDRRDPLTGVTFALFIVFAITLIAIDQRHPPKQTRVIFQQWCLLAAVATIALGRFHWAFLRRPEPSSPSANKKETDHGKK